MSTAAIGVGARVRLPGGRRGIVTRLSPSGQTALVRIPHATSKGGDIMRQYRTAVLRAL
jgi:hypothetical protein